MLERCRLFRILALGETVLATGLTIVVVPVTVTTVATGSAALLGSVALWLVAFGGWAGSSCDTLREPTTRFTPPDWRATS